MLVDQGVRRIDLESLTTIHTTIACDSHEFHNRETIQGTTAPLMEGSEFVMFLHLCIIPFPSMHHLFECHIQVYSVFILF